MANALPRALETFRIPFTGGRHRTPPLHFGRLKTASALEPNGGRLSASFDGGQRKIIFSAKAEHNNGGNSLDEGPEASEYLVGREFSDCERRVNVWWDAGKCPPPLNFDVSKIGNTIVEFLRRNFNTSRPIYLRVYGNLGDLLPSMAKDTVRIISESGFKLAGFELKDNGDSNSVADPTLSGCSKYFGKEKTLMTEDLIFYGYRKGAPTVPIHMVILDGKVITASALAQLVDWDRCCLICVEPEQESVDGVWRWKPLWADQLSLPMGQCGSNGGGNSLDEGDGLDDHLLEYDEHGDDEDILKGGYFEFESLMRRQASPNYNNCVNIWWDSSRCPPPSNFDISKIGITLIEFLEDWTHPIYLHVYGNLGELLPKMVNDTIRIFSQSSLKLKGFEVKDNSNVSDFILAGFQQKRKYFSNVLGENLMMDDLIYHKIINHSPSQVGSLHMVVLDGKVITTSTLYQHRLREECILVSLVPDQESINGVWHWKPIDYWE